MTVELIPTPKEIMLDKALLLYYLSEQIIENNKGNPVDEYLGLIRKTAFHTKNLLNTFSESWTSETKPIFNRKEINQIFLRLLMELTESLIDLRDPSYSDFSVFFQIIQERLMEDTKDVVEA